MNTKLAIYLIPLVPLSLFAQQGNSDVSMNDVTIVVASESTTPMEESNQPATVIEIPDAEVQGASIDTDLAEIPMASEPILDESDVVLELPGQSADSAGEASMAGAETITVDFPDEDVRTILRNVADLFELNLVIPDTLQGRTSLKLRNITWRQVFEVVLQPLGYTFVEEENIIRIRSTDEMSTEPVDTRVFVVNYASAAEIMGSVEPLVDAAAGGRMRVDTRSNALVVTERPSRMSSIQEIIDLLDRPTHQVMIESKFIEVTQGDTRNIGVNWASLSNYSLRAGDLERSYTNTDETDDTTTLTGNNTEFDFLANQQALAGQVTGSGGPLLPAPTNIDDINAAIAAGDPVPTAIYEDFGGESVVTSTVSNLTSRIDTAVFSADQFEIVLSALNSNSDVKLVSNPTVVTLNNKLAKIAIGEKFPIPTYSFNSQTGERQLNGIEFEDIGITLDVTPQVNADGFINLNIIPEVSDVLGTISVEGTQIPRIASRRAETDIMIKDGFTLAIGGLTENRTSKDSTKVPVLGDLPGIGRLFKSDIDVLTQRNLIIFITARTLNPDGSDYREIIDPRTLDQMSITPSDVPGYQVSEKEKEQLRQLEDLRLRSVEARRNAKLAAEIQKLKSVEEKVTESETSE